MKTEEKKRIEIALEEAERAYATDKTVSLEDTFCNNFGVEGFTVAIDNYQILSLAGSNEVRDWWRVNLNGNWIEFCLTNTLYRGFEEAYQASINQIWKLLFSISPQDQDFASKIKERLEIDRAEKKEYIFTGHSSGAAIVLLASLDIASYGFSVHLVTVAQPKLGHIEQERLSNLASHIRVYHPFDPIIHLPIRVAPRYGEPFPVSWFSLFPHSIHSYKSAVFQKLKNDGEIK